MSNQSDEAKEAYTDAFKELADRIQKRCEPHQRFEVLLGSALDGTKVNHLESRLMDSSVSNDS